jgi:hypothetical protein
MSRGVIAPTNWGAAPPPPKVNKSRAFTFNFIKNLKPKPKKTGAKKSQPKLLFALLT